MVELAFPYILILLPLPFLINRLLPEVQMRISSAMKVPFYEGMREVSLSEPLSTKNKIFCLWAFWVLLLIAASGPQWVGEPQPVKRVGRNIMLALDLSGSMKIDDMRLNGRAVNRLAVVKVTAERFIKERKGDRIGLVLFGTHAYLQTPLTFDRQTVLHMLDDATVGLAGQTTSIGDAIGLAIKRLDKVSGKNRVLILLTDGENNSGVIGPIKAAEIARDHKVKIYTIGIGADEMVVQGFFGPQAFNPSADLDERTLKKIASLTGGTFFRARDTKQLENVYKTIDKLEPTLSESKVYRPIKPYYYWPLALALVCFFYLLYGRVVRLKNTLLKEQMSHG